MIRKKTSQDEALLVAAVDGLEAVAAHATPEDRTEDDTEASDATSPAATPTVNLQKRDYDLDPTRFNDWELNGRCIDF